MRIRHPAIFSLLIVVAVTAQLSCARLRSSTGSKPTASASKPHDPVTDILDRYEQAIGGKEAIERITSYKMKGTFELSNLREPGAVESWGKEPNKTLISIDSV